MADFAASLRDNSNNVAITLSANGTTFSVTDYSNYSSSTEDGHIITDFSEYRTMTISTQSGANVVFTSLIPNTPNTITAGSTGNDTFNLNVFDGDGVYKFELLTLPTWSPTSQYDDLSIDHVYYNGVIYKAVDSSIIGTSPDLDTVNWVVVSADSVPSKYRAIERVATMCEMTSCKDNYISNAICSMNSIICDDEELCSNSDFMNANKLMIISEGLITAVSNNDWETAENCIRLSKKICNCKC